MTKPVNCSMCNEPATVFFSTIIGGEIKEVCFCEKHATQSGILDQKAYAFAQDSDSNSKKNQSLTCPTCAITIDTVKKSNRLGCPDCYNTFEEYINDILYQIQKNKIHVGKIPSKGIDLNSIKKRIKALEIELNTLVKEEKFEDAALIRDTINNFRSIIQELIDKKNNIKDPK